MSNTLINLGISTGASTIIATSIDASPLITALITFGISMVTIVGSEVIKFLTAYLKNKTKKYDIKDEDKERDK